MKGVVLVLAGLLASPAAAFAQAAPDLALTPVPRCRVIDTRLEGGPLVAGEERAFDVAGSLSGQGGAADCQIPFGAALAVVIQFQPVQPQGDGQLTAWAFGGATLPGALVEFTTAPGGILTSERLVALCDPAAGGCTRDLAVRADGSDTHLVADVTGYFAPVDEYQAGSGVIRPGTQFSVDTTLVQRRVQACPPGSAMRAIDASGNATCEADHGPVYDVGYGLTKRDGFPYSTFSVDIELIQRGMGYCLFDIYAQHPDGYWYCAPKIRADRESASAGACPNEQKVNLGDRYPFTTTPIVVVTPVGRRDTTAPPNSYCVVDDVTTEGFSFCCYGDLPEDVHWIAVLPN